MLEVQLELNDCCVVWVPDMLAEDESANSNSVRGLMTKWVNSFFEVSTLIQQLGIDHGKHTACTSFLVFLTCVFDIMTHTAAGR